MLQQRGCLFHFAQCIWRRIQSDPDLLEKCQDSNEPDFLMKLRQVVALAYVPSSDVQCAFEHLVKTEFFQTNNEVLQDFLDYFEQTWTGRHLYDGSGRRPPKFCIELWNCYSAVKVGLPRTNNHVEGWHRRFSGLVNCHHPSIWTFIDKTKEEQVRNNIAIQHFFVGEGGNPPRRKYRELAERIVTIVREYEERTLDD